jgi:site-specific recombinase XerD
MNTSIKVYALHFRDRLNYQLQWRDPITRKWRTKTTNIRFTGLKRDQKVAERLASEWERKLNDGEAVVPAKLRWDSFRERYEAEVAKGLATRTAEKIASVFDRFEAEANPIRLWDVDERRLSYYVTRLRAGHPEKKIRPLKESTIDGHLAHLKAALSWAKSQKMIPHIPTFPKIKRAKMSRGEKVMRGRPITLEEFERMLAAVPEVVGQEAASAWMFYLRGLWSSGLRLAESLQLYWDRQDKLHPTKSGPYPMLRIPAELEKGHKDRLLPMAPEFSRLLSTVADAERHGPVFKLARFDRKTGRLSPARVSKIVTKIGAAANVRVDEGKTASAHDLRRAFGEYWATKLMPAQLMVLMRHESIETTMKFYVGRNAERTAAMLWTEDKRATGESVVEIAAKFGIDEQGGAHAL